MTGDENGCGDVFVARAGSDGRLATGACDVRSLAGGNGGER